jgi:hypothetical protein
MKHSWTPEKLSALKSSEIRTLRANAFEKGVKDLVELCDQLLSPAPSNKFKVGGYSIRNPHDGEFVAGYHFVCRANTGVELLPNGTFWSRTWVVSRVVVENSLKYAAYLALHETKTLPSYLQGIVEDFRIGERFGESKTEYGIDFLIRATPEEMLWAGNGTVEKSYFWRPIAQNLTIATEQASGTPS